MVVQSEFTLVPEEKPKKARPALIPGKRASQLNCKYDAEGNLYYERAGKYCPYKYSDYQLMVDQKN